MLSDSLGQTWGILFATALAAYDFNVDFQDISKRLDNLMKEIREIQEMNARYWELSVQIQGQRAAYDARQLRIADQRRVGEDEDIVRAQSDLAVANRREVLILTFAERGWSTLHSLLWE